MSVLAYRCPTTSQDVTTSLETDAPALARLRNLKIGVACPHCLGGHIIPADEMFFAQVQWTASPLLSDCA
jgi:hypothetical protein